MARPRRHVMRDARQLDQLAAPVRQRMVNALGELGTASVGDVARHLGEPADKLYFHLRKLVAAGLVVAAGRRPGARRPEQLYRLVRPGLVVDRDNREPGYLASLERLYTASIREAQRNLVRALRMERGLPARQERRTGVVTMHARLAASDRKELLQRLVELADWMASRDDPAAERCAWTAVVSPVVPARDDAGTDS